MSDDSAFITEQNIVVDGGTNSHISAHAQQTKLFADGFEITKNY